MDDEIFYAVALSLIKGIGPVYFKKLIDQFKSPKEVFEKPLEALYDAVPKSIAKRIYDEKDFVKTERILRICERHDIKIYSYGMEGYPKRLLHIHTPPPMLYVKGDITEVDRIKTVGIVGTRRPSQYGVQVAEWFSRELSKHSIGIVSGGAYGIDTIALKKAKEENAYAIAVLGNGLLNPYPSSNRELFKDIVEKGGAIISEFLPEERPNKENFPKRNRIISALSDIVLVVEAGKKSGSLITAAWAEEQNKDVYAIPGPITKETSEGTNHLIQKGARIALSPDNILQDLGISHKKEERKIDISEEEKNILEMLSDEPLHFDTILEKSNMEVFNLYSILFGMELKGLIRQLPGKYYVRAFL